MRYLMFAAAKDVRRRVADPASMVIWIAIPLLLAALMNLVLGGDGNAPAPRARVLLVDQDNTVVSSLLTTAAGRGDVVDLETLTLEEGQRRIDAGEGSALVVIPQGFQDSVLLQTPAEITVVTNPAERILPSIVRESLEIAVEVVFYAQQLFGPSLRRIGSNTTPGQPADADVSSLAVEINQALASLNGVAFPPVIELTMAAREPDAGPVLSFGQLFLPGMLFMSFLFVASGMSGDIWDEQRLGTLRKALTTPQSAHALLAGKLLAGVALMSAVGLIALVGATLLFGLAWTRLPVALAWCAFAGGALLALLSLVQTFASGQRAADMLMTMMIFPLMMLGGSFFPFEAMPDWMAAVGRWTPNGLGVVILRDLLYGSPAPSAILLAATGIGVPALAAFVLASRRLRGKFATL